MTHAIPSDDDDTAVAVLPEVLEEHGARVVACSPAAETLVFAKSSHAAVATQRRKTTHARSAGHEATLVREILAAISRR